MSRGMSAPGSPPNQRRELRRNSILFVSFRRRHFCQHRIVLGPVCAGSTRPEVAVSVQERHLFREGARHENVERHPFVLGMRFGLSPKRIRNGHLKLAHLERTICMN